MSQKETDKYLKYATTYKFYDYLDDDDDDCGGDDGDDGGGGYWGSRNKQADRTDEQLLKNNRYVLVSMFC